MGVGGKFHYLAGSFLLSFWNDGRNPPWEKLDKTPNCLEFSERLLRKSGMGLCLKAK